MLRVGWDGDDGKNGVAWTFEVGRKGIDRQAGVHNRPLSNNEN